MIEVSSHVADRYRIDARIGGGGMADVFEARDEALDRDVAIKLLRGIDDPAAARRFAEEIRLTARLNHPNVVRLFDAGEHEGSPFLVLERVTGGTLAHAMNDGGLPAERVADIGRQTAAALEHAHGEGIVHRDVKPSNILLTADGTVRLADFGIALTATATRLTVAGSVAGSAGYVSPEQVLGTGAGAASDVYALGLVLLECLTGAPPWSGTTVEVALARITADPPIPDVVPESWRGLLAAMTARNPDDRPPMGLVAAALGELAAGRPAGLFPLPVPPAPPRRLRVPAAVGSAMLLLAAGALLSFNAPSPGDATPTSVPSTVAPDGVIAASVVRGAAVGEAAAPATTQADAAEQRPVDRERSARKPSGTTATNVTVPSGTTIFPSGDTAPGVTAPTAAKPAGTGEVRDTSRETVADPVEPAETDTGTTGGDATDGDTSDGDTADGGDSRNDSTDDVADTEPKNNGKGKGAKTRGPNIRASDTGLDSRGLLK